MLIFQKENLIVFSNFYDVNDFKNKKTDKEIYIQQCVQYLIFETSYKTFCRDHNTGHKFPDNLNKSKILEILEEWKKLNKILKFVIDSLNYLTQILIL